MGLLFKFLEYQQKQRALDLVEQERASRQEALTGLAELDTYDPFPTLRAQEGGIPDFVDPNAATAQGGEAPPIDQSQLTSGAYMLANTYAPIESKGNWYQAQYDDPDSGKSYVGLLQWGPERRAELGVGDIPVEDFKNDVALQNQTANKYDALLDAEIERTGLEKYIGEVIDGVPITRTGIKGIIHHAGLGGATTILSRGSFGGRKDRLGTETKKFAQIGYAAETNTAQRKLEQAPPSQRMHVETPDGIWESKYYTSKELGEVGFDERMNPEVGALLDRITENFGKKLTINSAFRDPEKNKKAGGASKSQHMHGNAIDISTKGMTRPEVSKLISEAVANGASGVGVYENAVHFDVRPTGEGSGISTWGPSYKSDSFPEWAWAPVEQGMSRLITRFGDPNRGDEGVLPEETEITGVEGGGREVEQAGTAIPESPGAQYPNVDDLPLRPDQVTPRVSRRAQQRARRQLMNRQGGALSDEIEAVGLKHFQEGYSGKDWNRKRRSMLMAAARSGDLDTYTTMADRIQATEKRHMIEAVDGALMNIELGQPGMVIEHLKKLSFFMNDGAVPVFDLHPRTGDIVVTNRDTKTGEVKGHPYVVDREMLEGAKAQMMNVKDWAELYYQQQNKDREFELDKALAGARMNKIAHETLVKKQEYDVVEENRDNKRRMSELELREQELDTMLKEHKRPEKITDAIDRMHEFFDENFRNQREVTEYGETKVIDLPMTPEFAMEKAEVVATGMDLYLANEGTDTEIDPDAAAALALGIETKSLNDAAMRYNASTRRLHIRGNALRVSDRMHRQFVWKNTQERRQQLQSQQQQPTAGGAAPAGTAPQGLPMPPGGGPEMPLPGGGVLPEGPAP